MFAMKISACYRKGSSSVFKCLFQCILVPAKIYLQPLALQKSRWMNPFMLGASCGPSCDQTHRLLNTTVGVVR
nr:unnamed protein product [Haemonchus contortus]